MVTEPSDGWSVLSVKTEKGGERLPKATGIVRRVDELGRVVIPVELRRVYGIAERDPLEIFTEGEQIILRKYRPLCIFCSSGSNPELFQGRPICETCWSSLGRATVVTSL